MPDPGFIWTGSSGCLLPFLIIFNLLFGKLIFNSTSLWLGIEAILILIFMIKIKIMARKASRYFSHKRQGKVVDIQGQVVEEEQKLK